MSDPGTQPRHPDPPPATPPALGGAVPTAEQPDPVIQRRLLEAMIRSRAIESRIVDLYRLGKITGGCYTGIGNEATSAGAALAMAPGDVLVPTHRDMGAHLVRGHTPLDIMRQYLKRGTSQTEGKDSGLHLGVEGAGIVGMISHLAHMMPVAVGVALAEQQKGSGAAVLTTVGDGSTSVGDFHEALNFAAVQRLPVVFVIENNQYAYSTPAALQYACPRLSDRAAGYGMPGQTIDGTDAILVWSSVRAAFARARAGGGPTLLESVTMRMRGHSEHDDFKYVPRALLDAWRRWDPIDRLAGAMSAAGTLGPGELEALRAAADAEIDRAVEVAEREPPPDPEAATRDVFRVWNPEWTVPSGTDRELGSARWRR